MWVLPLFLWLLPTTTSGDSPCAPRLYPGADNNVVCVCNSTYCDEISGVPELADGEALVIQSSLSGLRFKRSIVKFVINHSPNGPSVTVDARQTYQDIIGFGGAFTDSAGINIASLSANTQKKLMEAYFSKTGLEYTLGRVPIASTDFSTHEYSYDDVVGDLALKNFALTEEDTKYKIPYIKKALELTEGRMKLFSSPWSAPGWMKTTGKMKGPGALKADPHVYASYAQYFVRFFEEYQKQNISFWASTIQNEPTSGIIPFYKWQTMYFSAATQRDFVKSYLGPALKRNPVTQNLQLMALDDNRYMLPAWAVTMFADAEVSSLVTGIAVHWYGDSYTPSLLLSATHALYPKKFILATEACTGYSGVQGPIMGDWYRAEEYADSIITDLNNWAGGWTDWNLCLDASGGPNWVNNVVDAPIIVNATSDEFYKQPMFYAMGHFSKFMRPGAQRIATKFSLGAILYLEAVATNLKGQRVLVILNRSSSNFANLSISEAANLNSALSVNIPGHSITTVVWNKSKL